MAVDKDRAKDSTDVRKVDAKDDGTSISRRGAAGSPGGPAVKDRIASEYEDLSNLDLVIEWIGSRPRFVSWKRSEGWTRQAPDVVFTVNGQQAGTGRRAFDRVLERMRKLPRGSRVLVLPYLFSVMERRDWPLDDMPARMSTIASQHGLHLLGFPECTPCDYSMLKKTNLIITWTAGTKTVESVTAGTEPAESICFLNGEEVGVGQEGYRAVLGKIGSLPPDSTVVVYPALWIKALSGRLSLLGFSAEQPWSQLNDVLSKHRLRGIYLEPRPVRVMQWKPSWPQYQIPFAAGEFVHLGDLRSKPEIALSFRGTERSNLVYTLNDEDIGSGQKGFHNALVKMREFPRGSILLLYPFYLPKVYKPFNDPDIHGPLLKVVKEMGFQLKLMHHPAPGIGKWLRSKSPEWPPVGRTPPK